jgi:DNA-binding GntR family transcriptional regulator
MQAISDTTTDTITQSLTRAIVESRLRPGAKLVEQKLADHYGVSRTIVRQALFQLSQRHLITLEPARGAFVSQPSVEEAQQVFATRKIIEAEMLRQFVASATSADIAALKKHVKREREAIAEPDRSRRVFELGDFHVEIARRMGNQVLASLLDGLISRCALIMLMYQSTSDAIASNDEHGLLVGAIEARDTRLALKLLQGHLESVERSLQLQSRIPEEAPLSELLQ